MPLSSLPPDLCTDVPGPRSRELARRLARVESRNVTCLVPEAPIFWERAQGSNVWDVDGNRFVDLGGAFAVANVGHAHPRVVEAVARQSASLLHGMGDVHPSLVKVELLEALVARFPGGEAARAVLGSSGSDAVEIALKTALLATGRPGVIAFEGAYHGLTIGALDVTWRADFRTPFAARLAGATRFARFGSLEDVSRVAEGHEIGAVIVEPIQGRGGVRIPPDGFLAGLRALCDARGWLLIADEIFTGMGRTGMRFACEHENVVPDLLCIGKGLASGMPLSACLGRERVLSAWPPSQGEAIHTQTFLGHPPSCAAALASIAVLEEDKLFDASRQKGALALSILTEQLSGRDGVREVRGRGLMIGIEFDDPEQALATCRAALQRGMLLLPAGDDGSVLEITPPLSIDGELLRNALHDLTQCLP